MYYTYKSVCRAAFGPSAPAPTSSPAADADAEECGADGSRAPVAASGSGGGGGGPEGGARLTIPVADVRSVDHFARAGPAQTQSSDEGVSDCSSATAASSTSASTPTPPATGSDAGLQLLSVSPRSRGISPSESETALTSASGSACAASASEDEGPKKGSAAAGEKLATENGGSIAELQASNQSLVQKLAEERGLNEDLLNRVNSLMSQLDKKEKETRCLEASAHTHLFRAS